MGIWSGYGDLWILMLASLQSTLRGSINNYWTPGTIYRYQTIRTERKQWQVCSNTVKAKFMFSASWVVALCHWLDRTVGCECVASVRAVLWLAANTNQTDKAVSSAKLPVHWSALPADCDNDSPQSFVCFATHFGWNPYVTLYAFMHLWSCVIVASLVAFLKLFVFLFNKFLV